MNASLPGHHPGVETTSMNSTSKIVQSPHDEIHVKSHLNDRWSDWFEGLAVRSEAHGMTILYGSIINQAALFGILKKIHALNLTLISVKMIQE
jgi:hypothetical protein